MTSPQTAVQEISIAHSPDSDDAFMFYGLATNKRPGPRLQVHPCVDRYRNPQPQSDQRSFLRCYRHLLSRLSSIFRTTML